LIGADAYGRSPIRSFGARIANFVSRVEVVDDDAALILGHEILGFPKTDGGDSPRGESGSVVGRVVRKGSEVLRIEARRVL